MRLSSGVLFNIRGDHTWHHVASDGRVSTGGCDYGGGKPTVLHKADDFVVVHSKSHQCFGGIGRRVRASAELSLYKVEWSKDGASFRIIDNIETVQPGHRGDSERRRLIQRADELNAADEQRTVGKYEPTCDLCGDHSNTRAPGDACKRNFREELGLSGPLHCTGTYR